MIENRILIREAEHVHPKLMFGRLVANELVYALCGDTGRAWSRERNESAECFEARIVRDLEERALGRGYVLVSGE